MGMAEYFERATRDDGTRYTRLRDDRPEWLQDAVYAAHDGELPNDWRYEQCKYIAGTIDDGNDDAMDIADALTDTYTHDLLTWVSGDLNRVGYVDEALYEMGNPDGLEQLIRAGQFQCLTVMAQTMINAWNEHANDETDETDAS